MKVLFLEPFYGGSHKAFADGLTQNSRHRVDLCHLPARFWKWRMRGAALHFTENPENLRDYDLVIASGLMSISDFKALAGRSLPVMAYFHENQFSYPLSPGERMDYQFGFTDIISALAADRVLFNSRTHMEMFFSHMAAFIRIMPDFRPAWAAERIREKTFVCYPGCDIRLPEKFSERTGAPLVIWNHRWEHDKNPESFFKALREIQSKGVEFRLALLGETFTSYPAVFDSAKNQFESRLVAFGYEPDRERYMDWLRQGAIVVSTANQENFGISVVEAAASGCIPLVPDRLSYPEIIPAAFHDACIYKSHEQLVSKLTLLLGNHALLETERRGLADEMVKRYSWENRIGEFDRHMRETNEKSRPETG